MGPDRLFTWVLVLAQTRVAAQVQRGRDRGDVPGWVMVTVMTSGLVVALFAVFRDAITDAVRSALSQVVSETGG